MQCRLARTDVSDVTSQILDIPSGNTHKATLSGGGALHSLKLADLQSHSLRRKSDIAGGFGIVVAELYRTYCEITMVARDERVFENLGVTPVAYLRIIDLKIGRKVNGRRINERDVSTAYYC